MVNWTEGTEVTIMEAQIAFKHDDCVLTKLSAAIPSDYRLQPAKTPTHNSAISAYFSVPHLYKVAELKRIFEGMNGNLQQATVREIRIPKPSTLFEITFKDKPLYNLFTQQNVEIESYHVTPDHERTTIQMIGVTPNELVDNLGKNVRILNQQYAPTVLEPELPYSNPDQARILAYLVDSGFFSLPKRGITLQQASKELGISDSALSLQLRDITGRIIRDYVKKVQTSTL